MGASPSPFGSATFRPGWLSRAAIFLGFVFAAWLLLPHLAALALRPFARDKAIRILEKRFDEVELESLDVMSGLSLSLSPRISAVGRGLSLKTPGKADYPPFIAINKFTADFTLVGAFLRDPIRLSSVKLDSLEINISRKREDDEEPPAGNAEKPNSSPTRMDTPIAFVVEELEADGTTLRVFSKHEDRPPLLFILHKLRIQSAGIGEPMIFRSVLDNAKPPGEIHTTGKIGPLVLSDPGATPVSGAYTFKDADLSVFKGIGGKLYSEGEFDGVLSHLEVHGFTDTPDFQLMAAGKPMHLKTEFDAIVDGTSGDTFLQPIEAVLGGSEFRTAGGVFNESGKIEKTICLDAAGSKGRIEDFLRLAMGRESPLMTGDIRFQSKIVIPRGDEEVVRKLVMDGDFAMQSVSFPDAIVQDQVDRLSQRGQGITEEESKNKRTEHDRDSDRAENGVVSNITGGFQLHKGVMTITNLSFAVPGAEVTMQGTYGLVTEEIDFRGELRLQAKLSETTSGFRSFLLKVIDPILSGDDGEGAVIPIEVNGKPSDLSFGVEMMRILTGKEVAGDHASITRPAIEPLQTCSQLAAAYSDSASWAAARTLGLGSRSARTRSDSSKP